MRGIKKKAIIWILCTAMLLSGMAQFPASAENESAVSAEVTEEEGDAAAGQDIDAEQEEEQEQSSIIPMIPADRTDFSNDAELSGNVEETSEVNAEPMTVSEQGPLKLDRESVNIKGPRFVWLRAMIEPYDSNVKALTWKSSDKSVVTVEKMSDPNIGTKSGRSYLRG